MRMSHAKCLVGYVRVSTDARARTAKLAELRAAGAKRIYSEKVSGKNAERTGLPRCLRTLQPGMFYWSANSICWPGRPRHLPHPRNDQRSRCVHRSPGRALRFCGDRPQDDPHAMRGRERRAMPNGVRFGAKPQLNPYQRQQARRMRPDGQSQRAVARLLGVDHQSNSRSAPETGSAFIFARKCSTSPPRQQRQNRAPTVVLVAECSGRHHKSKARERSASEGQVAHATW
jgi:hypothetical protein